ncbi:MAG TPA: preprotein translocase subunit SecA, partial [Candidatus Dormibacteraeota bacterium]
MPSLAKLFDPNEREIKRHLAVAAAVTSLEPEIEALDDAALRERSDDLRKRAQEGEDLNDLLIEAFALCREASRRTIGLRHFDVQL